MRGEGGEGGEGRGREGRGWGRGEGRGGWLVWVGRFHFCWGTPDTEYTYGERNNH